MALDMQKLNEAEKELDKKSGSKNWIQLSKIDKSIDIKIMDPLPSMNGIYYVEVPVWWINSTRLISPRLYGPAEVDPIQTCIDDAKLAKDPDILKLLNAKDETKKNAPKIQLKYEYWVPALKFNFTIDPKGPIKGIYGPDGKPDANLIDQFIEDGKWKIVVMGIQALKAINKIATSRMGYTMVNKVDGFNLTLNKTGVDRNTIYSALKADPLPMPDKYYTDDKMLDPFEVAESLMFTDKYMDAVIGKYLYGEDCPDKPGEEHYANPELREKLKSRILDEEEAPAPVAARQRPGRASTPAPAPAPTPAPAPAQTTVFEVDDKAAKVAAARALLAAAEAEAGAGTTPVTPNPTPVPKVGGRTRAGTTSATTPPVIGRGGTRPQRNLSADLQNVD